MHCASGELVDNGVLLGRVAACELKTVSDVLGPAAPATSVCGTVHVGVDMSMSTLFSAVLGVPGTVPGSRLTGKVNPWS